MDQNETKYQTVPPNYSFYEHSTNSFTSKPSPAQTLAYILILIQLIVYFTCILTLNFTIPLLILYCLFAIITFFSALASSIIDPTDKTVYKYYWGKHLSTTMKYEQNQATSFCDFCDSYCHESSKHCRVCNRCVRQFDHHCIWINNCVGQTNYKAFFIMILAVFLHLIVFIVHGIVATATVQYSESVWTIWLRLGIIWIISLILLILQVLLFNLILLHLYLNYHGITTYELLKNKRAQAIANEIKQRIQKSSPKKIQPLQNKEQQQSRQVLNEVSTVQFKVSKRKNSEEYQQSVHSIQALPSKSMTSMSKISDPAGGSQTGTINQMISADGNPHRKLKQRVPQEYSGLFIRNPSLRILVNSQAKSPTKRPRVKPKKFVQISQ